MCDEKKVKVCSCCGIELPISNFTVDHRIKDGYSKVCNSCKAQKANGNLPVEGCNQALSEFTPRDLIIELRARGYRGTLHYTVVKEVVI